MKAYTAGADDYQHKPFDNVHLLEKVKKLLAGQVGVGLPRNSAAATVESPGHRTFLQEGTERTEPTQRADPFKLLQKETKVTKNPFPGSVTRFVLLVIFCSKV